MEITFKESLANFWTQGDAVSHAVILVLFVMSILSWMQIVLKALRVYQRHNVTKAVEAFWHNSSVDKALKDLSAQIGEAHNFTDLAKSAVVAVEHFDHQKRNELGKHLNREEFISRTLRQSINRSTAKLESGMTVLASIGAVAPFVGLFGTVYGIYHALIGIAAAGSASLNTVSGPVGEALIMTALGLFVAIPAVLAYNAFVRYNRLELMELDGFAYDLLSFFDVGGKISTHKK